MQTTKLHEGEKILKRFQTSPTCLQIMNEASLLFKIQSSTKENVWYHVSLQSSYCDCPDWSTQCKHLYGVRLIVMQYFPHLKAFLDGTHDHSPDILEEAPTLEPETQMDSTNYTGQAEDAFNHIEDMKNMLSSIQKEVFSKDPKEIAVLLQRLHGVKECLSSLVVPKQIEMPRQGSIRQIQAHVTQTRLGHGVPQVNSKIHQNIDLGSTSQPSKPTRQTGQLRRKHQRGRTRVRFDKRPRIWCPHCCNKTLFVDPQVMPTCHTCHAILPLKSKYIDHYVLDSILCQVVHVCNDSDSFMCSVYACQHGSSTDDELIFTLKCVDGNQLIFTSIASEVRMIFVYTSNQVTYVINYL